MATPPKFGVGDKLRGLWNARGQVRGRKARPALSPSARGGPGGAMHPVRQPSRWLRNLVILIVLLGGGLLAWQWSALRERTLIGSAYAARVGCVCRFVSQRDLKSCEADLAIAPLDGVAGAVSLSADEDTRSVTAGLMLLGHQTARYDPAYGCRLDPWDN